MVVQSTDTTDLYRRPPPARSALPVAAATVVATGCLAWVLAGLVWRAASAGGPPVAFAATLGAGALMLVGMVRSYPHDRFGLCNALTLGRAGLVAVLAVAALSPEAMGAPGAAWAALAIAVAALALDGLDGWAARRAGLASAFGARFDMEVDTALAFVLAVLAWQSGKVGPWVLALGLMRPAFVLAGLALPRLRRPLPVALWRKAICVLQIGALTAMLAPVVPAGAATVLAALALTALVAGFARDVAWLWQRG